MSLPGWFLLFLMLPPVELGKSCAAGAMLMLFLGLGLLLPVPTLKAAANAPFVPEYVFTGALAFDEFRPNAAEAPTSAALREAVVDEVVLSWLAKVEVREGVRGAAMSAGGSVGWPRDHLQDECEASERDIASASSNRRGRVKRKPKQALSMMTISMTCGRCLLLLRSEMQLIP